MYHKKYIFLLPIFCFSCGFSQTPNFTGEHINQSWGNISRRAIDSLNDLADTLCLYKQQHGRSLALSALRASRLIRYYVGIGDASHSLGLTHFRRNNDSALYYFKQAKSAYEVEYPGFQKMAFTLNNISRTYDELQRSDSALFFARNALAFVRSTSTETDIRKKWLMYTFGAMGNAYSGQSRYDSAGYYYLNAVHMAEQSGNNKMLEVYYKALSGIQTQLGEYEKAAEYGRNAVIYGRDDCRGLSIAMANLAAIYSKLSDYKNADMMADSSIIIGRACNVWNSVGRNYSTLGNTQLQQKNYSGALRFFKTGLEQAILHHNSKSSIGNLHRKLGEVYEMMDSITQAKESYLTAMKFAEGDMDMQAAAGLSLSKILYRQGDLKAAYDYLKFHTAFRDTIYTKEKVKVIADLIAKYESDKKDQQLMILRKENEFQAILLEKNIQQLAKEKAEAGERQLELANYALQTKQQEQLLRIQQLDIENRQMKSSEQEAIIEKAKDSLQAEKSAKSLAVNEAKRKNSWLIYLVSAFAMVIIISILLFNRYRLLKQLQSRDALMLQRERISRELHDEVGATLSGIAMYSHLAKEQLNDPGGSILGNSLNIIQQNAGEMVNKLNDIVWLINPGNDNLQQLLQRLEDYAVQMAAVKGILVKSNINGQYSKAVLPAETRRNIYLLFKEAVNNAVKYSQATLFEFVISEEPKGITISFIDNGKGFDREMVKNGNGLHNMQKRAGEIGADLQYVTVPDTGVKLVLHLPQ